MEEVNLSEVQAQLTAETDWTEVEVNTHDRIITVRDLELNRELRFRFWDTGEWFGTGLLDYHSGVFDSVEEAVFIAQKYEDEV